MDSAPKLSYAHGTSPVPLLGETIGENLRQTVSRHGDRMPETLLPLQHTFKQLRADLAASRAERRSQRFHADGHVVAIRALPDYDALFGVDFDPRPDSGAVTAEGM